jgi:hypothetical protein
MIFQITDSTGESKHFWGGYHFADSAVVAWPVHIRNVRGHPTWTYFEPVQDLTEPCLIPIFSLDEGSIKACTYKWRSWLYQVSEFPQIRDILPANVRPFLVGKFRSVLQVLAEHGFFTMTKHIVMKFAEFAGLDCKDGWSTFDLVFELCKKLLPHKTEAEILDGVHRRLCTAADDDAHTEELLQIDGAIEVMDVHDHRRIKDEQKAAAAERASRDDFSREYRQKRSAVDPKSAEAACKGSRHKKKVVYPKRIPSTIPQEQAKLYIPVGASI